MVNIDKLPETIVEALHERGHSDEYISQMQPETVFIEYCEWHGLIGWGAPLWALTRIFKDASE